jgi:GNAT superfamily N-acetyltransferase
MTHDSFTHLTIRAPAGDEADALADLRVEAMRESLERVGRFDPERARARFLSGYSPQQTRVVEADGERAGFFVVKPHEEGLLLDHLYVAPKHQRKGIGAAVLERVFAQAASANLPVRVGALRESESNAFYVRHGFVLVDQGEFDNYYVRRP